MRHQRTVCVIICVTKRCISLHLLSSPRITLRMAVWKVPCLGEPNPPGACHSSFAFAIVRFSPYAHTAAPLIPEGAVSVRALLPHLYVIVAAKAFR